jgi:hypothetical protein
LKAATLPKGNFSVNAQATSGGFFKTKGKSAPQNHKRD